MGILCDNVWQASVFTTGSKLNMDSLLFPMHSNFQVALQIKRLL